MKLLRNLDVKGKKVLVRVDYNVPLDKGQVVNDNRIRASLPTINYLLQNNCKIILVTHIGRPDGKPKPELRTDPVAKQLSKLLGMEVKKSDLPIEQVKSEIDKLRNGEVLMLENIRFYPEEETNDKEFGKKLASLADVYVNDAFAVCHRDNSSVSAITEYVPSCAGLLLEKEVSTLGKLLEAPEHPYFAIIGGAKLETKIPVIENLLKKTDRIIIGGAMIFPFFKSIGLETGKSLFGEKDVPMAKKLLERHKSKLLLPTDILLDNGQVVDCDKIPAERAGMDIGPKTIERYRYTLRNAETVVWNGPMGKFEDKQFAQGTYEIAKMVSSLKGMTVVGGGETVTAVEDLGLADKFTLVSTGGGAALEFLEGKKLPAIAALDRN